MDYQLISTYSIILRAKNLSSVTKICTSLVYKQKGTLHVVCPNKVLTNDFIQLLRIRNSFLSGVPPFHFTIAACLALSTQ